MNKKYYLISHRDLDGVVCNMIVKHCLQNHLKMIYECKYSNLVPKLRRVLVKIAKNPLYRLIITDISPNEKVEGMKKLENRILWIDHHETNESIQKFKNHVWDVNKSAALLTYEYFSRKFDLSHLEKLVYHANDYDLWIHESPLSWPLADIYTFYWSEKFMKRFETGKIVFNDIEKQYLKSLNSKRKKVWERVKKNVRVSENEFGKYYIIFERTETNFIAQKLSISNKDDCDFVIIVSRPDKVSCRVLKPNVNLLPMLKNFADFGGHPTAAGGEIEMNKNDPFIQKFFRGKK